MNKLKKVFLSIYVIMSMALVVVFGLFPLAISKFSMFLINKMPQVSRGELKWLDTIAIGINRFQSKYLNF